MYKCVVSPRGAVGTCGCEVAAGSYKTGQRQVSEGCQTFASLEYEAKSIAGASSCTHLDLRSAGIHTRVKAHISMYRPHALHARHGLHSTSIGYASTLIMSRTDTGQSNLRCVSGPTRNRLAQPCMEHRDIPGASHKRRMDERGKEPPTGEIHEVVRRTARCPPWLPRRHGGDPLRAP